MRKHYVKHDNLRRYLDEFERKGEKVGADVLERILDELRHSNLIVAADIERKQMAVFEINSRKFGFLFTDMDEFRKFIPDGECGSQSCDFEFYKKLVDAGDVDGFVINPLGEAFPLTREIFDEILYLPEHSYPSDDAYTTGELKTLKDSIDNRSLERFIENPSNIGRYEDLFEEISHSTLLTLMVSYEDLTDLAEDGVISMVDTMPRGFLYLETLGGRYATVYTSEEKIANVSTALNKYSQIVNFSQMTNYILNEDLDGIIINPNSEGVMLTREVLLEYWSLLEDWCNDSRLNTAIMHMFLIGEVA